MIKCKVGRLRKNGNFSLIHSREDFNTIIKAHNMLVDVLEVAYDEINRLDREIEKLKAGEQE